MAAHKVPEQAPGAGGAPAPGGLIGALLAALPDTTFVFDRAGRYRAAFPGQFEALGPPFRYLGQPLDEALPADLAALIRARVEEVIARGRSAEVEYEISVAGSARQRWARIVPIEWEGEPCALWVRRDVTALRRAEAEVRRLNEALERDLQWRSADLIGAVAELRRERDEHANARAALERREALLRAIHRNVPCTIFRRVLRPDGHIEYPYIGGSYLERYGYSSDGVDSIGIVDTIHPEDRGGWRAAVERSARDLTPFDREFRVLARDGGERRVRAFGAPQREADGSVVWDIVEIDFSDLYRARSALGLYQQVVEQSRDVVTFIDPEYRYRIVSDGFLHLVGRGREEVVGRRVGEIVGEQAFEDEVRPRMDLALDGEAVRYQRWLEAGNERRYLDIQYTPMRDGDRIVGIATNARDITERERWVEALRTQARRQRLIARLGQQALSGLSPEKLLDEAMALAVSEIGVRGVRLFEPIRGEDRLLSRYRIGPEGRCEDPCELASGSGTPAGRCLEHGRPVFPEDDGGPLAVVLVPVVGLGEAGGLIAVDQGESARDLGEDLDFLEALANLFAIVRERQRTERRLHERERALALLSRRLSVAELGTSIVHQVAQPLTALVNYTEGALNLLREDGAATPGLVSALETAGALARKAAKIGSGLRDLLRGAPAERRRVDVNAAIREALPIVAAEAGHHAVRVATNLEAGLPLVVATQVELEQLVLNLCLNAVESMAEAGGDAHVLAIATSRNAQGEVELAVADTGPGVARGDAIRIFEAFVTTRAQGLGLGLSICRTIVESYRGRLWAERNATGGATFRVALPPAVAGDATRADNAAC